MKLKLNLNVPEARVSNVVSLILATTTCLCTLLLLRECLSVYLDILFNDKMANYSISAQFFILAKGGFYFQEKPLVFSYKSIIYAKEPSPGCHLISEIF
jgi:hypothetical protein